MLRTPLLLALLLSSCGAPATPGSGGDGLSAAERTDEILPLAAAPAAQRTDAVTAPQNPFAGFDAKTVTRDGDGVVMTGVRLPGPNGVLLAETLRADGVSSTRSAWRADRMTLRGVEIARPASSLRIGTLSLTDLTLDAGCEVEAGAAGLLACARWDEMVATFVAGEGIAAEGAGPDGVRWRVGLATLSGFDHGRVAEARLQDVSLRRATPAAAPTLPRLAMRLGGAPFGLGGLAEADAVRLEAVRVSGASLEPVLAGELSLAVSAVRLDTLATSRGGTFVSGAAGLDVTDLEVAQGALVRGALTVRDARSDLAAGLGAAARAAAREADAEVLRGNASVAYAREVGGARLDARWSLPGAGEGRLGLDLTDGDGAAGAGRAIGVSGGRLDVLDTGGLDAAFVVAAAAEGQEASLLRRQVVGALTFIAMREAEGDPALGRMAGALLTFAAQGGGVEVVLRPEEPVPPTVLAQAPPGEAARRLGLTVSVRD